MTLLFGARLSSSIRCTTTTSTTATRGIQSLLLQRQPMIGLQQLHRDGCGTIVGSFNDTTITTHKYSSTSSSSSNSYAATFQSKQQLPLLLLLLLPPQLSSSSMITTKSGSATGSSSRYVNTRTTVRPLPHWCCTSSLLLNHPTSTKINNMSNGRNFSSTNDTPPLPDQSQPFVPMTKQEEEDEKTRVSQLSVLDKDLELRNLNRQISTLEKKRGINTGELYTWSGMYKALARDYGMPLVAWYWAIWISTGIVCYTSITLFDLDVIYILQQIDIRTGYHISEQVNPEYGKIGAALLLNEIIEPIRLPLVIVTVKPVMDKLFPPKY